jgi:hypothetical protein
VQSELGYSPLTKLTADCLRNVICRSAARCRVPPSSHCTACIASAGAIGGVIVAELAVQRPSRIVIDEIKGARLSEARLGYV